MLTKSLPSPRVSGAAPADHFLEIMILMHPYRLPLLAAAIVFACLSPASAQNQPADQKPPAEQQMTPEQKAAADQRRSVEEFNEAAKLPGAAGLPECVFTGRRIAALIWNDDVDTARRHLEFYERFGCPTEHLKVAVRCLVRQGKIDTKARERVDARAQQCWVNPDYVAAAAAPASAAGAAPAAAPAPGGAAQQ
ncbi:hypothetical protein [Xanthobacter wiegelii]|uniref:hypothetical protein n=2 Tax=Xanthobacteraceae TaxID=335928 RepID=UPI00372B5354